MSSHQTLESKVGKLARTIRDGGTCTYEVIEFSTHTCQGKEVSDGEMTYDDNEDVRRQGEEEEGHGPQLCRLAGHHFDLSEHRSAGPIRADLGVSSGSRHSLHHSCLLFLLESMRRDVRILLVGDGTSFLYFGPCRST